MRSLGTRDPQGRPRAAWGPPGSNAIFDADNEDKKLTDGDAQSTQRTFAAYDAIVQMIVQAAFTVEFRWRAEAEGEGGTYAARMDWHEPTVQLKVFDGRNSDFVCQSLPGKPFKIDPSTWRLDVPHDELDRCFMRVEQKGQRKGGKR